MGSFGKLSVSTIVFTIALLNLQNATAINLLSVTLARMSGHSNSDFLNSSIVTDNLHNLDEMFSVVRDRMSIVEIAKMANENVDISLMEEKSASESEFQTERLCSDKSYKSKLLDSIKRTLNFYGAHLDDLRESDHAAALSYLKAVEIFHGGGLTEDYPVASWMSQICKSLGSKREETFCFEFVRKVLVHSNFYKVWLPSETLEEESKNYQSVGHEKENSWTTLNSHCLEALIMRCEVPHACERVMFDSEPRSAYQLTHQLMHREIAEMLNCLPDEKRFIDQDVNNQLCAKMYQEANLIAFLDKSAPVVHLRDLFAEQVAFCGYIGYRNFFRADWLEMILSSQSKSEFGCFLDIPNPKLLTSDTPILRKLSKQELAKGRFGLTATREWCKPHMTSVSLMALAMYWDYMEDNCATQTNHNDI